mgnify:CR=1 FL=1
MTYLHQVLQMFMGVNPMKGWWEMADYDLLHGVILKDQMNFDPVCVLFPIIIICKVNLCWE